MHTTIKFLTVYFATIRPDVKPGDDGALMRLVPGYHSATELFHQIEASVRTCGCPRPEILPRLKILRHDITAENIFELATGLRCEVRYDPQGFIWFTMNVYRDSHEIGLIMAEFDPNGAMRPVES